MFPAGERDRPSEVVARPAYGSTWDAAEKGRAGRSFHPDKYLKRKGKREKIPQMTV